jgi:hypothetical protein
MSDPDYLEQRQTVSEPSPDAPAGVPDDEADEADAQEQAAELPADDEER